MPKITLDLDAGGVQAGAKRASSSFKSMKADWASTVTGMNQGLTLITGAMRGLSRMAVTAGESIGEAFGASSKAAALSNAVTKLSGSSSNAAAMLEAMQRGTAGLIPKMELMQQASTILNFGVAKTADEMETLSAGGLVLARAMGTDASKGVSDLATALGRGSNLILDNLGVVLPLSVAYAEYGVRIDKTTKQMTEAEKKEAFRVIAIERIKEKMETLGGVQVTANEQLLLFNTLLANNKLDMQSMTAEALGPFVGELADFVKDEGPGFLTFLRGSIELTRTTAATFTALGSAASTTIEVFSGPLDAIKGILARTSPMFSGMAKAMGWAADESSGLVREVKALGASMGDAVPTLQAVNQSASESAQIWAKNSFEAKGATKSTGSFFDSMIKLKDEVFTGALGAGSEDAFWSGLTSSMEAETSRLMASKAPDNIADTIEIGATRGALNAQSDFIDALSGPDVANQIADNLSITIRRGIKKSKGPADVSGLGLGAGKQGQVEDLLGGLQSGSKTESDANLIIKALSDGDEDFAKSVLGGLQDKIANSKRFGSNDPTQRRARAAAESEAILLKKLLKLLGVQGFAGGSGGFQNFGGETTVNLHGREAVVRPGGADADSVLGAGALDDMSTTAQASVGQLGLLHRIAVSLEGQSSDAIRQGRKMLTDSNDSTRMMTFSGGF